MKKTLLSAISLIMSGFLLIGAAEKPEDTQKPRNETTELENKLSLIKIPEVRFFKSPLDEAMQELMLKSKQFDLTEKDPAKKGIPILVMKPSDGDSFPLVTIAIKNMELGKMIQWITEMVNWTYDIKAEAVVISKSGGSFKGRATLETEFYEVTQGTINLMTGGAGSADDPGQKIKAFLEGAGISFDHGNGHKFVFDGFQMIVTHDRRSLALIDRILAKLDSTPMEKATELMKIMGVTSQIDTTQRYMNSFIDRVVNSQGLAEEKAKLAKSLVKKSMASSLEAIKSIDWEEKFAKIYVAEFTTEELQGLIDFYKSPIGKKFLEKQPQLMAATMGKMSGEIEKLWPKINSEVMNAIEEVKK